MTPVSVLLAVIAPVTVEMSPCGTQVFERVPTRAFVQDANYLDIVWTLGHDDAVVASGPETGLSITNYFAEIPGYRPSFVNRNRSTGASRLTFDKEFFYALGTDILHLDPLMLGTSGFTAADRAEIAKAAGPFFANRFSRDDSPVPDCPDYKYYTLLELTGKASEVYRENVRFAKLKSFIENVESNIVRRLPPPERRPSVALLFYNAAGNSGRILPFEIRGGFGQAQYRLLGVKDAFAGKQLGFYGTKGANSAGMDLEGLLAIDPDIIIMPFAHVALFPGGNSGQAAAFRQLVKLKNDPVGRLLTAVKNGRIYDGGTPLQGPITYLFQLELAARQIYPDIFPSDHPLFDRTELSRILHSDL